MNALRDWISGILMQGPAWVHWLMLGFTAVCVALVLVFVDLTPHVDEDFFFSESDPQFQQSKQINATFKAQAQLILNVAAPDIATPQYRAGIQQLTAQLKALAGVIEVRSLTAGPKNFADALASPLWRRLLIAADHRSSNLIVLLERNDAAKFIRQVEATVAPLATRDFVIHIAGAPYVVAMIQRNLRHDFVWFSATAVLLFGGAMLPIFRSVRILLGMLATCISAIMIALLVQSLCGMKIGILTANLSTIVFVLTFSHLAYLTSNWRNLARGPGPKQPQLTLAAYWMTLPPSSWCMACTALGFATLLLVKAKPLRELGFGGTIGTLVAFLCAYTIYPFFLRTVVPPKSRAAGAQRRSPFGPRRFLLPVLLLLLLTGSLALGMRKLNTDPSLLDYFKRHEPLRDGLEYVDRNGGSSPLDLVVAAADGSKLNTEAAYKKMWQLQAALEHYPAVGSVISLPVLTAEGERVPLAFLLPEETLLRLMDKPAHGRVASNFITADRTRARFLLRMVESDRHEPRAKIVADLSAIVRAQGFQPVLIGSIYQLQGRMAKLVSDSLLQGIGWLFGVFFIVALLITRSVRTALAMLVSLSLCRICMLGAAGFLNVPIDIISAPAANICIGMAVDSMIHLVYAVRRNRKLGTDLWQIWVAARDEQWRAVAGSATIIATGFAIFTLSDFPPTQRFGLVVIFGTLIDIMATLLVLPLLGAASWKTMAKV